MFDMRGFKMRYDGKTYTAVAIEDYSVEPHDGKKNFIPPTHMRVAALNDAGCLEILQDRAFRFRFAPITEIVGGKFHE